MRNEQLRLTLPIWHDEVDDGGMFPTRLAVYLDPDPAPFRYLAVASAGFGGGAQARRGTFQEARDHTETLRRKLHG